MAHCLSEWTGKKHSSIVQSSERTQRSSSQTSTGHRDPHRQNVCDQQTKMWPTGV